MKTAEARAQADEPNDETEEQETPSPTSSADGSDRAIKALIPLARTLIEETTALAKPDGEEQRDTEPPPDPSVCPNCGGRMIVLRTFDPERRDPFDTS